MNESEFLTLKEAAMKLKVSYARAAELARAGLIPVVRLGRQVRVDAERLREFRRSGGQALSGGWRR